MSGSSSELRAAQPQQLQTAKLCHALKYLLSCSDLRRTCARFRHLKSLLLDAQDGRMDEGIQVLGKESF
jgi:hypothetical protein